MFVCVCVCVLRILYVQKAEFLFKYSAEHSSVSSSNSDAVAK